MKRAVLLAVLLVFALIPHIHYVSAASTIFSEDFEGIHIAKDSFSEELPNFLPVDGYTVRQTTITYWETRKLVGVYGRFEYGCEKYCNATTNTCSDYTAHLEGHWLIPDADIPIIGMIVLDSISNPGDNVEFKMKDDYMMTVTGVQYKIVVYPPGADAWYYNLRISGQIEILTDLAGKQTDYFFASGVFPSAGFSFADSAEYGSKSMRLNATKMMTGLASKSSGFVQFRIKWDGTKPLTISSFASIDSNSYLVIGGVTTNLTLQQGEWNEVVISWGGPNGDAYVFVNTPNNIYRISGLSSLDLGYFGDTNDSSNTLIDDIEIKDSYISAESVQLERTGAYSFTADGKTFYIWPEGGQDLGNITVKFLDGNMSLISSITLDPDNRLSQGPNNATYVSLERGNVQRIYLLTNLSTTDLAFPALADIAVKTINVYIYPPTFDLLEVRTLDGKLVFRGNITDKASLTAVYGEYYIFTAYSSDGQATSMIAQAVDDVKLSFELPGPGFVEGKTEKFYVNKDKDKVLVQYYNPDGPVQYNLSVLVFDKWNHVIYRFLTSGDSQTFSYTFDLASIQNLTNSSIAYVRVVMQTPDRIHEKVLSVKIDMGYLLSKKMFPMGFRLIIFGTLGVFLVGRKYAELSPLMASFVLFTLGLIGLVAINDTLTAILGVTSALGLFTGAKKYGWLDAG